MCYINRYVLKSEQPCSGTATRISHHVFCVEFRTVKALRPCTCVGNSSSYDEDWKQRQWRDVTQCVLLYKLHRWVWLITVTSIPDMAYDKHVQAKGNAATCVVPRTHTGFGDRAFQVAGPRLWNSLPASLPQSDMTVGQFKKLLKTHLFSWDCGALYCLLLLLRRV